ncbi:flagellar hook-length control protein FliK [Brevundimonas sp.]|uniref:flagellar hook-length control protein FliK n=1 Tax=Brevundimonas sp. TaxID=1871086 RepID=UPI00289EE248|nr:flagellar hook-length control protein FliK [Brevundimonas sp.]
MSASAILSVMMGGALNGASAIDSVAHDDAALSAETLGAEFAALLNPEGDVAEKAVEVETAAVMAPTPMMTPVIIPEAPPAPAPTLEDGDASVDTAAPATSLTPSEDAFTAQVDDQARLQPLPVPQIDGSQEVTGNTAGAPSVGAAASVAIAPAENTAFTQTETEISASPFVATHAHTDQDAHDAAASATRQTAQPNPLTEPHLAALNARQASSGEDHAAKSTLAPSDAENTELPAQVISQDAAQDAAPASARTASAHAAVHAAQQVLSAQAQPLLRRLMEQAGQTPADRIDITPTEPAAQTSAPQAPAPPSATTPAAPTALAAADLPAQASGDAPLEAADPLLSAPDTAIEASADTAEKPLESRLSLANVRTTAEMAAHIIMKLGQRTSRFDMVLTPENLGMVDVTLEVDNDGQLRARMVFDNPAAAQDLRARAEELRRQLAEAGFQLSDNALEFTDRDSQSRDSFQQFFSDDRPGRRAFAGANRLAVEADTPIAPVWTSVSLTPRGVDMKV